MSQESESVAEDRSDRTHAFGYHPTHNAPDPYGPSHRWWVHGRADPCLLFGLGPAGLHGQKSDHQALAFEPLPQAWLWGGPGDPRPGKGNCVLSLVSIGVF